MRLRFSPSRRRASRVASFAAAFAVAALAAEPAARADCDTIGTGGTILGSLLALPVGVTGTVIASGVAAGVNDTRDFNFGKGFGFGVLGATGGAGAGALLSYAAGCPGASVLIPSISSVVFGVAAVTLAWSLSPELGAESAALGSQPMAHRERGRVGVEIMKIRF